MREDEQGEDEQEAHRRASNADLSGPLRQKGETEPVICLFNARLRDRDARPRSARRRMSLADHAARIQSKDRRIATIPSRMSGTFALHCVADLPAPRV